MIITRYLMKNFTLKTSADEQQTTERYPFINDFCTSQDSINHNDDVFFTNLILQFFNTKYLANYVSQDYLCDTFFFISLGLVRLVSLVSFSKRMKPPGFILFNFIQTDQELHFSRYPGMDHLYSQMLRPILTFSLAIFEFFLQSSFQR